MAFPTLVAAVDLAVFTNLADGLATWTGVVVPVPIILAEPDETSSLGPGPMVRATRTIHVRKVDVPTPIKGDLVVLGARSFSILGKPMIDEEGTVWACQAAEQSS